MVEEFVSDSLEHPLPFVLHDAANSGKYLHTITLFRALQPNKNLPRHIGILFDSHNNYLFILQFCR